jgi:hypothetical protein
MKNIPFERSFTNDEIIKYYNKMIRILFDRNNYLQQYNINFTDKYVVFKFLKLNPKFIDIINYNKEFKTLYLIPSITKCLLKLYKK